MPLFMAFVDNKKAFDSINHHAVFEAMKNVGWMTNTSTSL